jgi:hypothetical protein
VGVALSAQFSAYNRFSDASFCEKRRSISGIVIDTDQFKQTKTLQEDELHIYDAYRAHLQTQEEFTLE